jgi:hypothetical protein
MPPAAQRRQRCNAPARHRSRCSARARAVRPGRTFGELLERERQRRPAAAGVGGQTGDEIVVQTESRDLRGFSMIERSLTPAVAPNPQRADRSGSSRGSRNSGRSVASTCEPPRAVGTSPRTRLGGGPGLGKWFFELVHDDDSCTGCPPTTIRDPWLQRESVAERSVQRPHIERIAVPVWQPRAPGSDRGGAARSPASATRSVRRRCAANPGADGDDFPHPDGPTTARIASVAAPATATVRRSAWSRAPAEERAVLPRSNERRPGYGAGRRANHARHRRR